MKNEYEKLVYALTWICIARQDKLHRKFTREDISDFVVHQLKTENDIKNMYINCCIENKYNNVAQLIANVRTKLWGEYNSGN